MVPWQLPSTFPCIRDAEPSILQKQKVLQSMVGNHPTLVRDRTHTPAVFTLNKRSNSSAGNLSLHLLLFFISRSSASKLSDFAMATKVYIV